MLTTSPPLSSALRICKCQLYHHPVSIYLLYLFLVNCPPTTTYAAQSQGSLTGCVHTPGPLCSARHKADTQVLMTECCSQLFYEVDAVNVFLRAKLLRHREGRYLTEVMTQVRGGAQSEPQVAAKGTCILGPGRDQLFWKNHSNHSSSVSPPSPQPPASGALPALGAV